MVGALLVLAACAGAAAPAPSGVTAGATTAGARPPPTGTGVLAGSCEPSAVVFESGRYLVGDNEEAGHLFAYDESLARLADVPLPMEIGDIEALAARDGRLVVVGSHSRKNSGARDVERERLLVIEPSGARQVPVLDCEPCMAAMSKAPDDGGFNIEGAVLLAGGQLVLGLRGPLSSSGRARLLVLSLDTSAKTRAIDVDLGGAAFRELTPWKDGFLAVSGPGGKGGEAHGLWWFAGPDAVPVKLEVALPASTEAVWPLSATELLYMVDGDGKNEACKVPAAHGRVAVALP